MECTGLAFVSHSLWQNGQTLTFTTGSPYRTTAANAPQYRWSDKMIKRRLPCSCNMIPPPCHRAQFLHLYGSFASLFVGYTPRLRLLSLWILKHWMKKINNMNVRGWCASLPIQRQVINDNISNVIQIDVFTAKVNERIPKNCWIVANTIFCAVCRLMTSLKNRSTTANLWYEQQQKWRHYSQSRVRCSMQVGALC